MRNGIQGFLEKTLKKIMEKYGETRIFFLHPNYEVLSYGNTSEVEEARWFVALSRGYPSIFFAGTPPSNPKNVETFLKVWFSERYKSK
jgi:hypothetical protein